MYLSLRVKERIIKMKTNTKIAIILIILGIASSVLSLILGSTIFIAGILLLLFGRKQEELITGKAPMILIGYRFGYRFEKKYFNNL
jgi:hypothetical protein